MACRLVRYVGKAHQGLSYRAAGGAAGCRAGLRFAEFDHRLTLLIRLTQLTLHRAREERLAQVAGSLTFTTVLAAVPLLAVGIALLTRFAIFQPLKDALQDQLFQTLLPAGIARTITRYLAQFAANAGGLTLIGSLFLVVSAVMMLLTVENALNRMWQVKQPRPILQRAGLYLLVLSLGPLVLAASLWATSALMATSTSLIGSRSPNATLFLNIAPVLLGAAAMACLFYFVPNTKVRGHHAIIGGLLASIALDLGKRGFAAYLLKLPTYKTVYGAFAALPLFLGWVYFSWLVTLGAALITANLARGGKAGAKAGARPAAKAPAKRAPRGRAAAR